ncbi:replication protein RepA [Pseudoalteromonas sp. Z1A8]|uniref:replication protein RepA n=1 Tax=Pseudoalteromonas sp. Z1A8 TaxID=2686354 RepID=UPI00140C6131|nr:replication protein RepA [Pseudoalteromonas sp. Z1A8]
MALSHNNIEIITKCPIEERTIGLYPAFLIDPCILPLKKLEKCNVEGFGKYKTVMLSSPQILPYGHYARLIIAHLTTQIRRRPELPSYVIAKSVSDLFQQITGQDCISGGTYANFLLSLERVFDTTFTVVSTNNSEDKTNNSEDKTRRRGFFAEADNVITNEYDVGQFNAKYKQVLYTPSSSFKALITGDKSIIPIDLRFLQLARAKDIVFAHDLYLFLIRRGYGRERVGFVPWVTLHKDIFPYFKRFAFSRFKRRFLHALDFILECHPHSGIRVDKEDKGLVIPPNNYLLRGRGG